ncbi:hypothetical protein ACFQO1_07915 [Jejudonia soesokkakensis]|uniref:YD repeat-containing protein n=1 Tax=Jejudonia soesokkakensis TaxID=1323432 RepID=A0ABW2MTN3_9FLAO
MRTLVIFVSTLFCLNTIVGQTARFEEAPLNPKPLEALKFVVPSDIKGDVAYYAGKFYDNDRKQLLEDGSSFTKYSQWSKEEAYKEKSPYMQFNTKGQLTEYIINNSSSLRYVYEYDSKGNLIKKQYQNDITTYEYDKKGRLDTEYRTFSTTDRTVSIKYTYKQENDLLKITKTSTYPDGIETEEFHFKDGRKVYEKSALSVESICEPDGKGNCVSKKYIKDNRIEKVHYNVVYRDHMKPEYVVVRDIRANQYAVSIPQIEIEGSIINLPMDRLKEDVLIYLPNTKQYLIANDFYDSKITKENPVPVEILQSNSPYLGIWYSETFPVFLKNGSREGIIKNGDSNYTLFYDQEEEKYFYIDKNTKGIPKEFINFKVIDAPLVMYMGENLQDNMTLIKGAKQYFTYGWSSKPLNEKEAILFYENTPLYIVPIIPKPEPLKIYAGRNYKGEKYE